METVPDLQGDFRLIVDGQEVMDSSSTIPFRICEETSGEVYEDVWRLGDELSWLLGERVTHSDGSKPDGSGGGARGEW